MSHMLSDGLTLMKLQASDIILQHMAHCVPLMRLLLMVLGKDNQLFCFSIMGCHNPTRCVYIFSETTALIELRW